MLDRRFGLNADLPVERSVAKLMRQQKDAPDAFLISCEGGCGLHVPLFDLSNKAAVSA